MKAGLPDVMMAALMPASPAMRSTAAASSAVSAGVITFIDRPGQVDGQRGDAVGVHGDVDGLFLRLAHADTRSMMVAVPMPAPMHRLTSAVAFSPALQLVQHGAEDHGARGAQRMPHGDGAAVHVDAVVGDVQLLHEAQHDRGKGLVELEEVDVAGLHPAALQRLAGRGPGAGQHDGGLGADGGEADDAGPGPEAQRLAHLPGADEHGGGAIDDPGRIAAGVHVVDALDFRIALQGHGVEAELLAHGGERGLELGERGGRGVRPHVLVVVQQRDAE